MKSDIKYKMVELSTGSFCKKFQKQLQYCLKRVEAIVFLVVLNGVPYHIALQDSGTSKARFWSVILYISKHYPASAI